MLDTASTEKTAIAAAAAAALKGQVHVDGAPSAAACQTKNASAAIMRQQHGGVQLYPSREPGQGLLQPGGSTGRAGVPVGAVKPAALAEGAHQGSSAEYLKRKRGMGGRGRRRAPGRPGVAAGVGVVMEAVPGVEAGAAAGAEAAAGVDTGRAVLAALERKGLAAADLADVEEILAKIPPGSLAVALRLVELMCKNPKQSNLAADVKGCLRPLR